MAAFGTGYDRNQFDGVVLRFHRASPVIARKIAKKAVVDELRDSKPRIKADRKFESGNRDSEGDDFNPYHNYPDGKYDPNYVDEGYRRW